MTDDGDLLVPHDAGCGADRVRPGDPRYAELSVGAVREADLNGTSEEDARLAAEWSTKWAAEERRTA